jgi:hypothetical protein
LQVLLGAAVTWMVALASGLTLAAGEIAQAAPEGSEGTVAVILRVVAWLGTAVLIVRRVTPVLPAARGLLPPRVELSEGEPPFWPEKRA